jgi:hypothetical protein
MDCHGTLLLKRTDDLGSAPTGADDGAGCGNR